MFCVVGCWCTSIQVPGRRSRGAQFSIIPDTRALDSMERCRTTQSGWVVTMDSAITGGAGASTPLQQPPVCSSSKDEERLTLASPQTPSSHLKKPRSQASPSGRGTRRPRPEAGDEERDVNGSGELTRPFLRRRLDMSQDTHESGGGGCGGQLLQRSTSPVEVGEPAAPRWALELLDQELPSRRLQAEAEHACTQQPFVKARFASRCPMCTKCVHQGATVVILKRDGLPPCWPHKECWINQEFKRRLNATALVSS
jgi:hypothetical protein